MSSAIANRVSRLEKAVGSPDDELVEQELSDEAKAILREALRNVGILTPDEIEARVNERRLVPKSQLRPLSPEASAVFEQARAAIEQEAITASISRVKHTASVGRAVGAGRDG
jgi:hypothetical protein